MRKILSILIISTSFSIYSQQNVNIENLKSEFLEKERENFENEPKPPLPMGAKEPKFSMQILGDYFSLDFDKDKDIDYIFRVKGRKYIPLKGESPFYYLNIILELENNSIKETHNLPNNAEIVRIKGDSIIFENQTLVYKDGGFYDSKFEINKSLDKYKFTSKPLLKTTISKISADGLDCSESGVFDSSEFRIKTKSTENGNIYLKIFFDSKKAYSKTKERREIIINFINYLNSNLNNDNHYIWLNDLKNQVTNLSNVEIEKIEPWNGLKYTLENDFNAHIYFLSQTYYNKSDKKVKVNKLVIELKK